MPHPRGSLWLNIVAVILSAVPGVALFGVSVLLLVALVHALVSRPDLLFQVMLLGLMVAGLWWLYMHLPLFLRRAINWLFGRKGGHGQRHGH